MSTIKHHTEQLANVATSHALANVATSHARASEFVAAMPKSVAIGNIAVGIASTTMTEVQMRALLNELEPVLQRVTDELKAVVNKHGISFSGHGAVVIGEAAFPTPEDRAEFEREVTPILALKTLLESTEGASGSFEA